MEFLVRPMPSYRKRTKTFTGCWTCRERKVKCDEIRPHCNECHSKRLRCEGYGARLQWLSPETGLPSGRASSRLGPTTNAGTPSRRELPLEPVKLTLSWDQVEDILKLVDAFELNVPTKEHHNRSLNIQNFGVFSLHQEHVISDAVRHITTSPARFLETDAPDCHLTSGPTQHECVRHDAEIPSSQPSLGSPSNSELAVAWELCNLYEHQALVDPLLNQAELQEIGAYTFEHSSGSINQQFPAEAKHLVVSSTEVPRSLPASILPDQERWLMHHYVHKVVNIFCVIDNTKSPWKTIHIPRAIEGAGELSIMGSTSRIRSALRNALLSISAFFLSNVQASHSRHDEASKWVNEAMRYRYQAIVLLKQAVECDLYSGVRPKYKEYLATMLSMITINVMSGDTSTCGIHLDGAQRLIKFNRKSRASGKTQALHRIYYYLRVIYESTSRKRRNKNPGYPSTEDSPTESASRPPQVFPCDNPTAGTPGSRVREQEMTEMASFECIYGIPQSLLDLLKDATNLVNAIESLREENGRATVPESLESRCDILEKAIFEWSAEDQLAHCNQIGKGTSFDIIYHQTKSFHNALIIYFAQNVRLVSFRYLQQNIGNVLDSIEAIESIKVANKILAAPIFWPAFVAASEAFDAKQQDRFRQWYERVAVYGIKAVRTGTRVVYEAWKRGPPNDARITSLWMSIIDETGETLMLT